jgi:hypothetical protein
MSILEERIKIIDNLLKTIEEDYEDLTKISKIDFENKEHKRIINSFLYTYTKLQDNIGAKLFKEVLFELKEIESKHLPMLDILHKLEKLNIIYDIQNWDVLREIRNELTHEYELNPTLKKENIKKAIWGYNELKKIYQNIKAYLKQKNLL